MRTAWFSRMTRLALLMIVPGALVPAARAGSHSAVSPEFTVDTRGYAVVFQPGAHGSLAGGTPNVAFTVNNGGEAPTAPTVTADAGWEFSGWEPVLPATITADITTTAQYAAITYTLTYTSGANGTVVGDTTQVVAHGEDAAPVTATADVGYVFDRWTRGLADYSTDNPLTLANVSEDMSLTALFREAQTIPPNGEFFLDIPDEAFAAGLALWPLSGTYDTIIEGDVLTLDLIHDTKGKIIGTGEIITDLPEKVAYGVALDTKGSAKGKDGAVTLKLSLKGSATGIPSDPTAKAKVSVKLTLTLLASSASLRGTASVSTAFGKDKNKVTDDNVVMDLPAGSDGKFGIFLDLAYDGKKVSKTGSLTLSNGESYPLVVKGKMKDGLTMLKLSGDKQTPAAKGIKLSVSIETLEDGSARVHSLSGKLFGQSIAWTR